MSKQPNRSELRFLLIYVICIAVFIWFLPSGDSELSTQKCNELYKLGEEKYSKDFKFDETWNFAEFQCNSHEAAMLSALNFLETVKTNLPKDEIDFDFYQWARQVKPVFTKRRIIGFSGIAYYNENNIHISTLKLEENDVVSIANIIVHELRHLDMGVNSHVPCQRLQNATCDMVLEENVFDGGAYNYNVAYLHRLIAFSDISSAQSFSARRLLGLILENRINFIPTDQRQKYSTILY